MELVSWVEVSGYLVGSTAFKAAETSDPRLAGSIPVHLRHHRFRGLKKSSENGIRDLKDVESSTLTLLFCKGLKRRASRCMERRMPTCLHRQVFCE
jgi:hypothetical protein